MIVFHVNYILYQIIFRAYHLSQTKVCRELSSKDLSSWWYYFKTFLLVYYKHPNYRSNYYHPICPRGVLVLKLDFYFRGSCLSKNDLFFFPHYNLFRFNCSLSPLNHHQSSKRIHHQSSEVHHQNLQGILLLHLLMAYINSL